MRGYYSLVQFCPDSARAEAANVGVVVLCPELRFIDCKMAGGNDRARKFFSVQGEHLERLGQMKEEFEERIRLDRGRIWKLEEFEQFIATRGNKLSLTAPRNIKVDEPNDDLLRLFKELVGGRAKGEIVNHSGRGRSLKSRLRELFSGPEFESRVDEDVQVKPNIGRPFRADYGFYNGKDSFVVAPVIHLNIDRTLREADLWALRAFELKQNGIGEREAELVVPLPRAEGRLQDATNQARVLLGKGGARVLDESELEDLAEEVRKHAHVL